MKVGKVSLKSHYITVNPNGENTVDRLKNSIIPKAPNPPAQDKSEKEIKPEKL